MAAACERCAKPVKYPGYELCWRCYNDDRLMEQYRRGFEDGRREGERLIAELRATIARLERQRLAGKRLRQLLQLCHPDRHSNSATANDATAWLNGMRRYD